MVVSTACVPKRDTVANPSNPAPADTASITALEAKVKKLESEVASLLKSSPGNYDADIEDLQSQMDDLQTQLDDVLVEVDDMLATWEEGQADNSANQSDGTTRWRGGWTTNYPNSDAIPGVELDLYSSPSYIEDADIYKIRLTIYNYMTKGISDLYVDIDFTPKSGDIVFVDEKNTYLDTVQSPYYWWDMEVLTRGEEEYARRITFTSEKMTVPAATTDGTVVTPSETTLTLEFNLEYQ